MQEPNARAQTSKPVDASHLVRAADRAWRDEGDVGASHVAHVHTVHEVIGEGNVVGRGCFDRHQLPGGRGVHLGAQVRKVLLQVRLERGRGLRVAQSHDEDLSLVQGGCETPVEGMQRARQAPTSVVPWTRMQFLGATCRSSSRTLRASDRPS